MDTFESGMNDGEDEELQVEESQLQEYNKCKEKASQKTASLKQDRDRLAGELRLAQVGCFGPFFKGRDLACSFMSRPLVKS